jgi:hypothetical protein
MSFLKSRGTLPRINECAIFCNGFVKVVTCKETLVWSRSFEVHISYGEKRDITGGDIIFAFKGGTGEFIDGTLKQFHSGEVQCESSKDVCYVYLPNDSFFSSHPILLDFFVVICRLCQHTKKVLSKAEILEELLSFYWLGQYNYNSAVIRFAVFNFEDFTREFTKEEYRDYINSSVGMVRLSSYLHNNVILKIYNKDCSQSHIDARFPLELKSLVYGK